jgi:hypothetical protein
MDAGKIELDALPSIDDAADALEGGFIVKVAIAW